MVVKTRTSLLPVVTDSGRFLNANRCCPSETTPDRNGPAAVTSGLQGAPGALGRERAGAGRGGQWDACALRSSESPEPTRGPRRRPPLCPRPHPVPRLSALRPLRQGGSGAASSALVQRGPARAFWVRFSRDPTGATPSALSSRNLALGRTWRPARWLMSLILNSTSVSRL